MFLRPLLGAAARPGLSSKPLKFGAQSTRSAPRGNRDNRGAARTSKKGANSEKGSTKLDLDDLGNADESDVSFRNCLQPPQVVPVNVIFTFV